MAPIRRELRAYHEQDGRTWEEHQEHLRQQAELHALQEQNARVYDHLWEHRQQPQVPHYYPPNRAAPQPNRAAMAQQWPEAKYQTLDPPPAHNEIYETQLLTPQQSEAAQQMVMQAQRARAQQPILWSGGQHLTGAFEQIPSIHVRPRYYFDFTQK